MSNEEHWKEMTWCRWIFLKGMLEIHRARTFASLQSFWFALHAQESQVVELQRQLAEELTQRQANGSLEVNSWYLYEYIYI